jgi:hypothetical protein
MLTRKCLVEQMARLAIAYNKDIKPEQETVYEEALSRYTDYILMLAISNIITAEKFFPVPAVIVSYCKAIKEDLERNAPEQLDFKPPENILINGHTVPKLCIDLLNKFESKAITFEVFTAELDKISNALKQRQTPRIGTTYCGSTGK